jgi:hypothetical protein
LILLGILFYRDNVSIFTWNAPGIFFPIMTIGYISFDCISKFSPKRVAKFAVLIMVLVLCWNIFLHTFLKKDCMEKRNMLKWGIYGEEISYCTAKRLIFQSILSLIASAAIGTMASKSSKLHGAQPSAIYKTKILTK